MTTTTRVVLARHAQGEPQVADFGIETADLRAPGPGEALLETLYLSLDPYMRGRMNTVKSYAEPLAVGDTMLGATVSRVLASSSDAVVPGDIVLGYGGWQSHSVEKAAMLRRLDPAQVPVTTALGVLGMPGFTAYAGMHNIGRPQPGETVVVAAAAGPVGSMVGQLAARSGARAIGIAGGAEKCRILTDEFGFDVAVDHRADDFVEQLVGATPDGIDVYFENVGGKVLDAVLPRVNQHGRIPVCGLISAYNATSLPAGPDRLGSLMMQIVTDSLLVRGFIVSEFMPTQMSAFLADMTPQVADGSVRYREDIVEGLDSAVEAFRGLLAGRNVGKLIVHLAD